MNNTRQQISCLRRACPAFLSIGDMVIFKDPEGLPAKEKKNAKDPFKLRNVVGIVKERRALPFNRVEWKKNEKCMPGVHALCWNDEHAQRSR